MSGRWFLVSELAHKWIGVSHSIALWSCGIHLLVELLLFFLIHRRLLRLHVHRLVVYLLNVHLQNIFHFYHLLNTLSASYIISFSIEFFYSWALSYVKSIKFPFIGWFIGISFTAERKFMFIYKVDITNKQIIIDYYIKKDYY